MVILPDNDAAGSKYADAVIGCLSKLKNPPTTELKELSKNVVDGKLTKRIYKVIAAKKK